MAIYFGTSTSDNLDDYEEGTWTAGATSGSANGNGHYVKVGNMVTFSWIGSLTDTSSNSMAAITGAPFAVQNGAQIYPQSALRGLGIGQSNSRDWTGNYDAGNCTFGQQAPNVSWTMMYYHHLGSTHALIFNFTFRSA